MSEDRKDGLPQAWAARNDESERVGAGRNRELQMVRAGKRKLFDKARRKLFLEWFAATCNVKLSAEQAGINYKTAFKRRLNDPVFAQSWDRALEQGVARAKAKLLETRSTATAIGIEGDLDAPEMETPDPQILIAMLRENERRLAGYPKSGRPPRVASNAEVRAALAKALRVFGIRVNADGTPQEGAGAASPGIARGAAQASAAGSPRAARDDEGKRGNGDEQ